MKLILRLLTYCSLILFLLLVLEGCKKYEEGPAISLRSREKRIKRLWTFDQIFIDGTEKTNTFKSDSLNISTLNIFLNGDFQIVGEAKTPSGNYLSYRIDVVRQFESLNIRVSNPIQAGPTQPSTAINWEIIQLKKNRLGFRTIYDNQEVKFYFVSHE